MNDSAVPYLRCPVCAEALADAGGRALRCTNRHTFDVARQGYVNLTVGRMPHTGDSAEMVAARAGFLAAGHYDVVTDALVDGAASMGTTRGLVVDAGTGTGWHLAGVLDAFPEAVGLGLDASKPALRRAARAHRRAGAALADLWRPLPLADACATLLLNVFAPRNGAEFHRVLRPDGALLVVTPSADHLGELVGALALLRVDPDKAERVAGSLGARFTRTGVWTHRRRLALTHDEVRTLVGMGPSAWHADPDRLTAAISVLPAPVTVTVAIDVAGYEPG